MLSVSGCGTVSRRPAWGSTATLTPGWTRVAHAARDAALSPATWAPLAGAGITWGSGLDRTVSNWAADNTPVFGSRQNADAVSYDLEDASIALYGLSVIASPGGDRAGEWMGNKLGGFGVQAAAVLAANGMTAGLKSAVGRIRPNGGCCQSFPSGHATNAAVFDSLTAYNLDYLPLSPVQRTLADAGLVGLTTATAWARIEARKHYPSDVLAGVAIGNFFSRFFDEAFLGADSPVFVNADIDPADHLYGLDLAWQY